MRLTDAGLRAGLFVWLVLAVAFAAPAHGLLDERSDVLRLRGDSLASQERCEEALDVLEEVRDDAGARLVAGECQIRLGRYDEAIASIEAAREIDPDLRDAALTLAIAHYHAGDLDACEHWLGEARERGDDNGVTELYTGLMALQRQDTRAAALSLERARRGNPAAVEPVASYYAFLAWHHLGERERAEDALARVRDRDPGGPWTREAERVLAEDRSAFGDRVWGRIEAGFEYDDNVVLLGDVDRPQDVSGKTDGRGVWSGDVGVELLRSGPWSGGVLAAYYGNAHFDLTRFDTHYPSGSLYLDHRFQPETTGRLRYDFGYAWTDEKPLVATQRTTATLFHDWGERGASELAWSYYWNNFMYSPRVLPQQRAAVNRDGFGTVVLLEHRLPVDLPRDLADHVELRGGYTFDHYTSRGSEYDFDSNRFHVGIAALLPFRIELDALGAFTVRTFDGASVFDPSSRPDDREDLVWEAQVTLEREIMRMVSAEFRYSYTDHDSNVDAYEYNRHIVGGYVKVRFY